MQLLEYMVRTTVVLISKLKSSQISLNRKMLAQMAVNDMDFI